MSTHIPHPDHEMASRIIRRIRALQAANPAVTFRTPLDSPSRRWEAEGPNWVIMEGSPSRFADQLEALMGAPKPKDVPGGSSPLPSPGDPGEGQ